jgi:hypothetical protein
MALNAPRCVLALSLVLAVGCASTPKRAWVKDGATQADFRRDVYACERDVRLAFPGLKEMDLSDNPVWHMGRGFEGVNSRAPLAMLQRCMEAQGYELRPVE